MSDEIVCQELVELLTEYLDGALDEGRRAAVVRHLAECDGCETYLDQLRTAIALLPTARPVPPDEVVERLQATFRQAR